MDDNSFGARLAAARRAAGYNQTEVAKYITEAGFPVRTQAVSKWERGTTLPSARQLVELCRLYHIRDVVAAFAPAEERRAVRTLPLYRLAVSAGTGERLDGTDYDTVEVGDEDRHAPGQAVRLEIQPCGAGGAFRKIHGDAGRGRPLGEDGGEDGTRARAQIEDAQRRRAVGNEREHRLHHGLRIRARHQRCG